MTVGIDEVGRGCWAGPLVAGAVVLARPIQGLRDSKKLSKTSRIILAEQIYTQAAGWGLGWVSAAEIDSYGLTWAVKTAMTRALAAVTAEYDEIIVDGNINYLAEDARARCLIRADDLVPAVSAASIIAKVARDRYMAELGEQYAGYGFANHVGYGTAEHRAALKRLGVSDVHRASFRPIRELL